MTLTPRPPLAQNRITVDVVIFTVQNDALSVLLVQRAEGPFQGRWALPGGFLWEGESSQQAAARVLLDKANVSQVYLEQLYTFDDPQRDPRGHIISITYFALVAAHQLEPAIAGQQHPVLHPLAALPQLAFDHAAVIQYAHGRLRSKLQYTNAAFSLLPASFTFSQLHKTYETILGHSLDRRNFRKKFLSLGLIKPTGERSQGAAHRPAELFTFASRTPTELDRWF